MITRHYFISAISQGDSGTLDLSYRTLNFKSFFPDYNKALQAGIRDIAKFRGIEDSEITVTSFNRI